MRRLAVTVLLLAATLGLAGWDASDQVLSRGQGDVYIVPVGETESHLLEGLPAYYSEKFGLYVRLLPRIDVSASSVDASRNQVIAEELIEDIKRAHPTLTENPKAYIIGVTESDMYIRKRTDWAWAFSNRADDRFAIVSTARMDPVNLGDGPNPVLTAQRLRKMISKNLGILYYRLPQASDRASVLYGPILGVADLDSIGETF